MGMFAGHHRQDLPLVASGGRRRTGATHRRRASRGTGCPTSGSSPRGGGRARRRPKP